MHFLRLICEGFSIVLIFRTLSVEWQLCQKKCAKKTMAIKERSEYLFLFNAIHCRHPAIGKKSSWFVWQSNFHLFMGFSNERKMRSRRTPNPEHWAKNTHRTQNNENLAATTNSNRIAVASSGTSRARPKKATFQNYGLLYIILCTIIYGNWHTPNVQF